MYITIFKCDVCGEKKEDDAKGIGTGRVYINAHVSIQQENLIPYVFGEINDGQRPVHVCSPKCAARLLHQLANKVEEYKSEGAR